MQNFCCRNLWILISRNATQTIIMPVAGVKNFPLPPNYDHVEYPERKRLRFIEKVPQYPGNIRPPKMMKNLKFMRGPETVHNALLHKQFGIIALHGGRMRWGHFEMVRLGILRKMDESRMFALWRIDAPWQPVTKKSLGMRMGGGKGAIDHYVTPVKAGRVIVEMGGKCDFKEVKPILDMVAHKLPFAAKVVTQEIMEKMAAEEERKEKENLNHYTMKYIIQNNLGGCNDWISPYDKKWFGKFR